MHTLEDSESISIMLPNKGPNVKEQVVEDEKLQYYKY